MKRGTRAFVKGWDLSFNPTLEPCTILRRVKAEPHEKHLIGYHVVRFENGGRLTVHESNMTLGNYGA